MMVPVDHLLLREAEALPSLIVVRAADGLPHFVVLWRRHGAWVQVMDPAKGRRWPLRGGSSTLSSYTTRPWPRRIFRRGRPPSRSAGHSSDAFTTWVADRKPAR